VASAISTKCNIDTGPSDQFRLTPQLITLLLHYWFDLAKRMAHDIAHRRLLLVLTLGAISVLVCIWYVDRPAAEFFNSHVRPYAVWTWLNRLLAPLAVIPAAALLFQLGACLWLLFGRRLASWTLTLLLYSWGTIWAIAAELVFKQILGRGSPDPTYLVNHLYAFRFLHPGEGWRSFPSGTATIALTIVAITHLRFPRWRLIVSILAGLACIGVTVTNGHWVSDVIAGMFLGAFIGWMTVAISGSSQIAQDQGIATRPAHRTVRD
jgi:membrane-associated phospholipid phosphatase